MKQFFLKCTVYALNQFFLSLIVWGSLEWSFLQGDMLNAGATLTIWDKLALVSIRFYAVSAFVNSVILGILITRTKGAKALGFGSIIILALFTVIGTVLMAVVPPLRSYSRVLPSIAFLFCWSVLSFLFRSNKWPARSRA